MSSKDNNFSVTAANKGRGVAELLVDPRSQGFKKYNDCKWRF